MIDLIFQIKTSYCFINKKAFIPIKGRRLYFAVPPKFIKKWCTHQIRDRLYPISCLFNVRPTHSPTSFRI